MNPSRSAVRPTCTTSSSAGRPPVYSNSPTRRRRQKAAAASIPVLIIVLTAFTFLWVLLLFAVLHNHVTEDITGLHFPKFERLRRRRRPPGGSDISTNINKQRNDNSRNDESHTSIVSSSTGSSTPRRVYHTCTCLNSTTLSNFTNNITHPYASPLPYGFEWLHIPKTGSSFAATLWSFACTRRGHIDLSISNDVGGSQSLPWSKNRIFHDMYEQALTARYPSEIYCHRDVIGSESIGHRPVTRDNVLDFNVAGFFRQPEERLSSAFDHGLHSTGFRNKTDLYQRCRYPEPGNFTCYATYPGIAGCQTRMLTGAECASHQFETPGTQRIHSGIENMRDMAFVGLTEEWGESICQFHKRFGGIPQQEQFGNIHPGHRHTRRAELRGWHDTADTAVYQAAVKEFERRRGPEQCYKAVSAESMETNSERCVPMRCADLGKQCGEWPDGCGGYVVCGVCNPSMDGLPAFWSARCSEEGQCLRICPGWEDSGLLLSNTTYQPVAIVHSLRSLGAPVDAVNLEMLSKNLKHITPLDAVRICTEACHGPNYGRPSFAKNYCACGAYPDKFLSVSPTWEDFQNAHMLKPILDPGKARVFVYDNGKEITYHPIAATAHLNGNATRPRCCDPLQTRRTRGQLPPHEDWLPGTIHADFFDAIDLGCGAHDACEKIGHERGATVVVYNRSTRKCYLGKNEGFDVPASETFSKREYLLI